MGDFYAPSDPRTRLEELLKAGVASVSDWNDEAILAAAAEKVYEQIFLLKQQVVARQTRGEQNNIPGPRSPALGKKEGQLWNMTPAAPHTGDPAKQGAGRAEKRKGEPPAEYRAWFNSLTFRVPEERQATLDLVRAILSQKRFGFEEPPLPGHDEDEGGTYKWYEGMPQLMELLNSKLSA